MILEALAFSFEHCENPITVCSFISAELVKEESFERVSFYILLSEIDILAVQVAFIVHVHSRGMLLPRQLLTPIHAH